MVDNDFDKIMQKGYKRIFNLSLGILNRKVNVKNYASPSFCTQQSNEMKNGLYFTFNE